MGSPALFKKYEGVLMPADEMAVEQFHKIRHGEEVRVDIKRVRNPKQLKYWWALCGVLAEYADWCPDRETASDWLKLSIGHAEFHESPDGKTWCRPKSISFGNCPQEEFDTLLDQAIRIIVTKVMPGTSSEALRNELEAMI